ncbi:MAG: hypothetical protein ACYC3S_07705 [Chloroflexota bacterium]
MDARLPSTLVRVAISSAVLLLGIGVFVAGTAGAQSDMGCVQVGEGQPALLTLVIGSPADTDEQRSDVARALFTACLDRYRGSWTLSNRLLDYRIEKVELYYAPVVPRPYVKITYSVWPLMATGDWVAGNGSQENGWIANKSALINLKRDGNTYWIGSMGTGP